MQGFGGWIVAVLGYDRIVVVMEENHDYSQIIGNPLAPYINFLASSGALQNNYNGLIHPSQGNYFGLYAGDTSGVASDDHFSEPAPSIATILQGAGKMFADGSTPGLRKGSLNV
jgi:hypothetical protein